MSNNVHFLKGDIDIWSIVRSVPRMDKGDWYALAKCLPRRLEVLSDHAFPSYPALLPKASNTHPVISSRVATHVFTITIIISKTSRDLLEFRGTEHSRDPRELTRGGLGAKDASAHEDTPHKQPLRSSGLRKLLRIQLQRSPPSFIDTCHYSDPLYTLLYHIYSI